MVSVAEILRHKAGPARTAELVAATSKKALATAVRRGEVERLARGIYVLPGSATDRTTAVAYAGVLSYLSAARAWNLPLLTAPGKPHVTVPVKRRPRPGPPAVLHWAEVSTEERRLGITSLLRTVLDCARVLPFGEALAVADAALASRHLHPEELLAAAPRALACRRRAPLSYRVETPIVSRSARNSSSRSKRTAMTCCSWSAGRSQCSHSSPSARWRTLPFHP